MQKRKIKDTVIKTITWIMVLVFILGAGSLDTPGTMLPVIMCAVPLAWFGLFMYANRDMVV